MATKASANPSRTEAGSALDRRAHIFDKHWMWAVQGQGITLSKAASFDPVLLREEQKLQAIESQHSLHLEE